MHKYKVKVRGEMFLWGSAGITQNASFTTPLLLHIRNDEFGELITVGTLSVDGTRDTFGTLKPGEAFSIAVQNINGVFASCALNLDSSVSCTITAVR